MSRAALVDATIASDGIPKVDSAKMSTDADRRGVVGRQRAAGRRAGL
jgi:hypothetical protein